MTSKTDLSDPLNDAKLTKINGRPDAYSLDTLKTEIAEIASTVTFLHPELNDNDIELGRMGLVLPKDDYLTVATEEFQHSEAPTEPTALQVTSSTTKAELSEYNRAVKIYEKQKADYNLSRLTDTKIRNLILEAVDADFVNECRKGKFGFVGVSSRTILEHLDEKYGKTVSPSQKNSIEADLRKPWNPEVETIEKLWSRKKVSQEKAALANIQLTDETVMRYLTEVIKSVPEMQHAIHAYEIMLLKKECSTYEEFQTHFDSYYTVLIANKQSASPTAQQGYSGAQVPPQTNPTALAATSNGAQQHNCTAYYCWSHGLSRNPNHTSPQCTRKKQGHKDEATLWNKLGGSQRINLCRAEHRASQQSESE